MKPALIPPDGPNFDTRVRAVRMTVELMEELVHAAAGRGYVIEWGEPDKQGYYTPVVLRDKEPEA